MGVTVEIPIPDELLGVLESRARSAGLNRDEYIRALVRRDLTSGQRLHTILDPFRRQVAESAISDDELTELFASAREDVYREKNP